jgi:hypothetical protein
MTQMRAATRLASYVIALWLPIAVRAQAAAVLPAAKLPVDAGTQPRLATPSALPLNAAPQLDGRLFFSSQERQRIDIARKRGTLPDMDGGLGETQSSTLNGFVKRSDGHLAVWVDGLPRWDATHKAGDAPSPSDIGGPAAYVKPTSGETMVPSPKHTVRGKKPTKPRLKKNTKRRLLR